jgi:hypothetical protein
MDNASIINDLNTIIDPEFYDLDVLTAVIMRHLDHMRQIAPEELMNTLNIELRCVHHEIRLGDGSYTEHCYNDCITAVKAIAAYL